MSVEKLLQPEIMVQPQNHQMAQQVQSGSFVCAFSVTEPLSFPNSYTYSMDLEANRTEPKRFAITVLGKPKGQKRSFCGLHPFPGLYV